MHESDGELMAKNNLRIIGELMCFLGLALMCYSNRSSVKTLIELQRGHIEITRSVFDYAQTNFALCQDKGTDYCLLAAVLLAQNLEVNGKMRTDWTIDERLEVARKAIEQDHKQRDPNDIYVGYENVVIYLDDHNFVELD